MESPQNSDPQPTSRDPELWFRVAIGLWIALTVAVTVKTVVTPDRHTVYPKIAARAISWWQAKPLYVDYEGFGRFPYSPTYAVAMSPFAFLGNTVGGILWTWLNIGVYVWGLRKFMRDVLPVSWPTESQALFLMLAMIAAIRGIWNAQSNALIIGLIMVGLSAAVRKRWWAAATWLAIPFYLKMWPIVIPLLMLVLWPRRFAGRFAVAMAIGAAIPFLTQPPDIVVQHYREWFEYLAKISPGVVPSYRDIWTVSNLIEAPIDLGVFRVMQLITAAGVLAWCLWQKRRSPSDRWLLTMTLGMGTGWLMIFGPAVEYNTLVVLAPMMTWAVMSAFETKRDRVLTVVAFLMTMILGTGAITRPLMRLTPLALTILPAGSALFVIWLMRYTSRTKAA